MNLLIVDDEIVTTQVLEEQLDRELLSIDQIYVAYNTSMARDILQKNKVELILCDIEMPKENGIHFLKWVREQKIQTEVIFLTSHEKFEYAYGAVQNGAANYLLKPIDMNKINQTLLRVTEKIVWKQKTEEIMNYFVALSSTQDTAEQIEFFFSKANLVALFNKLCNWSVSLAAKIIMALIVWQIGKRLIIWMVKIIVKALGKSDLDVGVARFIGSITKFAGYAILILIVVGILGIPTASLITVFGSAALAVGMSLQGSLSNFAGGILLLIFKPFKIGDYIISGSCEGTVVSIELLYTKLHTIDNKIIMMPNGTLSNSNIINVGAEEVRRLDIQIGVGYQTDLSKAKALLMECLNRKEEIIKDKDVRVIVKSLDESCITLETRAWVANDKYWDTRFELLEEYKKIFDENGIEIPFNQLDVHITK